MSTNPSLLAVHQYGFGFETNCTCGAPGIWSWSDYRQHLSEVCTITTVAELDALPDGAVIKDQGNVIVGRNPVEIYPSRDRPWWPLSGYCAMDRDFGIAGEDVDLPALLVWSPGVAEAMSETTCAGCGHLAYFHTEMRSNPILLMRDVVCRAPDCDCPKYAAGARLVDRRRERKDNE